MGKNNLVEYIFLNSFYLLKVDAFVLEEGGQKKLGSVFQNWLKSEAVVA